MGGREEDEKQLEMTVLGSPRVKMERPELRRGKGLARAFTAHCMWEQNQRPRLKAMLSDPGGEAVSRLGWRREVAAV